MATATYFIATEYIEGRTLRTYMSGARIKTSEVLDAATQVASALQQHTPRAWCAAYQA